MSKIKEFRQLSEKEQELALRWIKNWKGAMKDGRWLCGRKVAEKRKKKGGKK